MLKLRVFSVVATCWLWAAATHVSAQDIRFSSSTVVDGLSLNTVTALALDRHGFLWVGTLDGLNRYDGEQFQVLRSNPGDSSSLPADKINALHVDGEGVLWIATDGGLARYDERTRSVVRDAEFVEPVSRLLSLSNGALLIASRTRGIRYRERASSTSSALAPDWLSELHDVTQLFVDRDRRLWIATSASGLIVTDSQQLHTQTASRQWLLEGQGIKHVFEDSAGRFWIGTTDNGLYILGPDLEVRAELLPEHMVYQTEEIDTGEFWVATYENGVYLINQNLEVSEHLKRNRSRHSLPNSSAFRLLKDPRGVMWVGTDGGLARANLDARPFGLIDLSNPKYAVDAQSVMEVAQGHDGRLYVGTLGSGVLVLDVSPQGSRDPVVVTAVGNFVTALHNLPQGILVGTEQGLSTISYTGDVGAIELVANGKSEPTVYAVHDDARGHIWVGTSDSRLIVLDSALSVIGSVAFDVPGAAPTSSMVIRALLPGPDDKMWILTNTGAYLGEAVIGGGALDINVETVVSGYDVRAIYPQGANAVHIATTDGLFWLSATDAELQRIDVASASSSGGVNAIQAAPDGALWLSTNNGLLRLDESGRVDSYSSDDGLQSIEFNPPSERLADGRIVFGGVSGLNVIDTAAIERIERHPDIGVPTVAMRSRFAALRASERVLRPGIGGEIDVEPDVFSVEFRYEIADYASPRRNRFAYRLAPVEDSWTEQRGSRARARYTNLSPGEYTFETRTALPNGDFGVTAALVNLNVIPPWWRTRAAAAVFAVGGIALFLTALSLRTAALRQRNLELERGVQQRTSQILEQKVTIERQVEELKEIDRVKERFFENISHEFRTPLALTIGPVEQATRKGVSAEARRLLKMASSNAHRLLRLIDQLLSISRLRAGTVQLSMRRYRLDHLLRTTLLNFEFAYEEAGVVLISDVDVEVAASFDAFALETVFSNLLSNALKFSDRDGEVRATLRIEDGEAVVTVADSGIGMVADDTRTIFDRFAQSASQSKGGAGIGLSLCKELVELHSGSITVASRYGEGSTFTVRLPLKGVAGEEAPEPLPDFDMAAAAPPPVTDLVDDDAAHVAADDTHSVLIVDDDEQMLAFLKSVLGKFDVQMAPDGMAAWEAISVSLPDLIISDVTMPGLNGFELARKVRGDALTSHIPFILLTARGGKESRLEGLRQGVDDYILKPFDADELVLRIDNVLGVRDALAQRNGADWCSASAESEFNPADRRFLAKFDAALQACFHNPATTTDDIASHLHMSERQLQRRLKGLLSKTPKDCLRDFRLRQAKALLGAGRSVSDAAAHCGFSTLNYFSSTFKAVFRMTPSQFKRSAGRDLSEN